MRCDLISLLLTLSLGVGSALAQVPDPMRPPAGALTTPEASVGTAAPVASGVQTVILRSAGKSAAVINGQYVEVGDKLGDKRVLKISESEVVLTGGAGREVIRLTPSAEKVPTRKTAVIKRRPTKTTDK